MRQEGRKRVPGGQNGVHGYPGVLLVRSEPRQGLTWRGRHALSSHAVTSLVPSSHPPEGQGGGDGGFSTTSGVCVLSGLVLGVPGASGAGAFGGGRTRNPQSLPAGTAFALQQPKNKPSQRIGRNVPVFTTFPRKTNV